jgi:hypothetical protein
MSHHSPSEPSDLQRVYTVLYSVIDHAAPKETVKKAGSSPVMLRFSSVQFQFPQWAEPPRPQDFIMLI